MSSKTTKWIYRISTGLLSLLMIMSAGMYVFKHEEISQTFSVLGYPTYIIYPLAIAKILGLAVIWSNLSKSLKDWAYAGFLFYFVLAFLAHVIVKDGVLTPALIALVLLITSYLSWKKLNNQ